MDHAYAKNWTIPPELQCFLLFLVFGFTIVTSLFGGVNPKTKKKSTVVLEGLSDFFTELLRCMDQKIIIN